MRIGISGTHGVGKTTLAEGLSAQLDLELIDEAYYLLEEDGYEFQLPPTPDDYRAMVAASVRALHDTPGGAVFDRTPLDYLAYLAALGIECTPLPTSALQTLDLLVVVMITPEVERRLPAPEMPRLRSAMNDALLELIDDVDLPVFELDVPLDDRLGAVLRGLARA